MSTLDYKQFTERHRPHIQPPDSILFVTYRLAGSIPKATVRKYSATKEWLAGQLQQIGDKTGEGDTPELKSWLAQAEDFNRNWFLKFEEVLHQANTGPTWMKDERVADAVAESIRKLDGEAYRLDAYSVMSNHVHSVFKPFLSVREMHEGVDADGRLTFTSKHPALPRIMQSLKGSSSRESNRLLSRTGQFWEHESFDHVVREGKFFQTIKYVLNNPVKVGLVREWREWRWNYCRSELSDKL